MTVQKTRENLVGIVHVVVFHLIIGVKAGGRITTLEIEMLVGILLRVTSMLWASLTPYELCQLSHMLEKDPDGNIFPPVKSGVEYVLTILDKILVSGADAPRYRFGDQQVYTLLCALSDLMETEKLVEFINQHQKEYGRGFYYTEKSPAQAAYTELLDQGGYKR